MRHKLGMALSLSRRDWWILAQAWFGLLAVDLGLRTLPFKRLLELLAVKRETGAVASADTSFQIPRVQCLVGIAARNHLYPMSCLRQALVLQRLLAGRGIRAELRIGVRKEADRLHAHAWVEYAGQVVSGPSTIQDHFSPLMALESNR